MRCSAPKPTCSAGGSPDRRPQAGRGAARPGRRAARRAHRRGPVRDRLCWPVLRQREDPRATDEGAQGGGRRGRQGRRRGRKSRRRGRPPRRRRGLPTGLGDGRRLLARKLGAGAAGLSGPAPDLAELDRHHLVGARRGRQLVQLGALQPARHDHARARRVLHEQRRREGLHELGRGLHGDRHHSAQRSLRTILAALQKGDDALAVAAAVAASPWGTGAFGV